MHALWIFLWHTLRHILCQTLGQKALTMPLAFPQIVNKTPNVKPQYLLNLREAIKKRGLVMEIFRKGGGGHSGANGGLGQINYTILYYTANHLLLLLLFLLLPYSSSTSSSSSTAVHCTSPLPASRSHQIRQQVVFVRQAFIQLYSYTPANTFPRFILRLDIIFRTKIRTLGPISAPLGAQEVSFTILVYLTYCPTVGGGSCAVVTRGHQGSALVTRGHQGSALVTS